MLTFNPDLVEDLARGQSAFFVGAGLSFGAVGRDASKHFLGWPEFLSKCNAQVSDERVQAFVTELVSTQEYPLAAEVLKEVLGTDWRNSIENCYNPKNCSASAAQQEIINSNAKLIVTTNFDRLLENYAAGRLNNDIQSVLTLKDENLMYNIRSSDRNIIKLHGCVTRPETMVFTKKEYDAAAFCNEKYFRCVENMLLNYTVLFIGFSMRDPILNFIIDSVKARHSPLRPHYIFVGSNTNELEVKHKFEARGFKAIKYNVDGRDHSDLVVSLKKLSQVVFSRRREMVGEAMSQFPLISENTISDNVVAGDEAVGEIVTGAPTQAIEAATTAAPTEC